MRRCPSLTTRLPSLARRASQPPKTKLPLWARQAASEPHESDQVLSAVREIALERLATAGVKNPAQAVEAPQVQSRAEGASASRIVSVS